MASITPSYPGVYLHETASIPHSVVPATTNLTAFLGWFPQGPTAEAVLVTSWPEFKSIFGDLDEKSSLAAYGVYQFFLNGGIGAWIVRLVADGAVPGSVTVTSPAKAGGLLTLTANGEGAWSSAIAVAFVPSQGSGKTVTHNDFVVTQHVVGTSPQSTDPVLGTIPNISLTHDDGTSLTVEDLAAVINNGSTYVTAKLADPGANATPEPAPLGGGDDKTQDDTTLGAAVSAELEPGTRLDRIAPAVFNLMCIPDITWNSGVFGTAHGFCAARQAFLLVDGPGPDVVATIGTVKGIGDLMSWADTAELLGPDNVAAAAYYPWVQITDPVTQSPRFVPPSGSVAGVYATTDVTRGVWKAPAGAAATLQGVIGLADTIRDGDNGTLNVVGINCLRSFPLYGAVVWGARTLAGSDLAGSGFKYVPVRRLTDFIEQSLQQSLRWAVFEPNGPSLWSSISLEVTSFMAGLFSQGAFAGATAAAAYQVVCDATTTSTANQLAGVVNVNVSFAPVDPAEFVMLNITIEAASSAS